MQTNNETTAQHRRGTIINLSLAARKLVFVSVSERVAGKAINTVSQSIGKRFRV